MKQYALIFRATRTFTPEEQKQRPVEIAAWVKKVLEMGIALDPRNFGETMASFAAEGGEVVSRDGSNDAALGTVVFFDSADREHAVEIARMHPALHYGVTVDVREWASPRPTVATP